MNRFLTGRPYVEMPNLPIVGIISSSYMHPEDAKGINLCVTGGREITDRGYVWSLLDTIHNLPASLGGKGPILDLGSGCATGVDELALEWAEFNNVPWIAYIADWDRFGDPAGCLRNGAMLEHFEPELLCVYDGGVGTRDCTKQARKLGIERMFHSQFSDDPLEEGKRWG